jgi:hypothetical protein
VQVDCDLDCLGVVGRVNGDELTDLRRAIVTVVEQEQL